MLARANEEENTALWRSSISSAASAAASTMNVSGISGKQLADVGILVGSACP